MKTLKLIPILLCIFMLNVASMCSSDDNSQTPTTPTNLNLNLVNSTITDGTWKITLYNDSGDDNTLAFSGYNFTFDSGNVLTASNGSNIYTGSWSLTDSNSNDDTLNDLHFNIAFTSPAGFTDLTDDWHIQSRTSTKIELIDVSGGNGGIDYLTFEKN